MHTQQNKDRVASAIEAFNRHDVAGYVAAYSPQCVLHGFPPDVEPTHRGLAAFIAAFVAGVPDARVTVEDVIAEGDRVVVRYTMRGTHTGVLFGAGPTGNRIEFESMTVLRFDGDGRIAERWQRADETALLTQLGLLKLAAAT